MRWRMPAYKVAKQMGLWPFLIVPRHTSVTNIFTLHWAEQRKLIMLKCRRTHRSLHGALFAGDKKSPQWEASTTRCLGSWIRGCQRMLPRRSVFFNSFSKAFPQLFYSFSTAFLQLVHSFSTAFLQLFNSFSTACLQLFHNFSTAFPQLFYSFSPAFPRLFVY